MKRQKWTVTRAEAQELERRDEKARREGGRTIEEVRAQMRADMAVELRRMAAAYDGAPARAKKLLEALVIAEAEGVEECARIGQRLAVRARRRRAA